MYGLKTGIYVAVSSCLIFLGVALLAWAQASLTWNSVATSLIAGGISSIAFSAIRYFDEKDNSAESARVSTSLAGLAEDLRELERELQAVRTSAMVNRGITEHRIFDRHPEEEVRTEIEHFRKTSEIQLDVMGLSLKPFYGDFMDYLIDRGNINLRLIVQQPGTELFSVICRQEARDEDAMANDILLVTKRVLGLSDEAGRDNARMPERSRIEVRWFPLCPSVSLTRVNDILFVRSRYLQEALHPPMFFERYHKDEGRCFDAYKSYFEKAWELSIRPTRQLCNAAEANLRQR